MSVQSVQQHRVAKQAAEALLRPAHQARASVPHGGRGAGRAVALLGAVVPGGSSRRLTLRRASKVTAPGPAANNRGAGAVVGALSSFLAALGVPHTLSSLRQRLRGGGGGNGRGRGGGGGGGGNWDGGDYAERLIDLAIFHSPGSPCLRCDEACASSVRVPIDAALAAAAAKHLVRVLDGALKLYKRVSLVRYVSTKVRPAALGSDRYAVLERVLTEYVDAYLPDRYKIRYDKTLDAELMARFKPQIQAFLRASDADLAPLVAHLVLHVARVGNGLQAASKTPVCMLCQNLPFSCDTFEDRATKTIGKFVGKVVVRNMLRALRSR